jgi:hypothetical protein
MTADLLQKGGLASGECLEVSAWWGCKKWSPLESIWSSGERKSSSDQSALRIGDTPILFLSFWVSISEHSGVESHNKASATFIPLFQRPVPLQIVPGFFYCVSWSSSQRVCGVQSCACMMLWYIMRSGCTVYLARHCRNMREMYRRMTCTNISDPLCVVTKS